MTKVYILVRAYDGGYCDSCSYPDYEIDSVWDDRAKAEERQKRLLKGFAGGYEIEEKTINELLQS